MGGNNEACCQLHHFFTAVVCSLKLPVTRSHSLIVLHIILYTSWLLQQFQVQAKISKSQAT